MKEWLMYISSIKPWSIDDSVRRVALALQESIFGLSKIDVNDPPRKKVDSRSMIESILRHLPHKSSESAWIFIKPARKASGTIVMNFSGDPIHYRYINKLTWSVYSSEFKPVQDLFRAFCLTLNAAHGCLDVAERFDVRLHKKVGDRIEKNTGSILSYLPGLFKDNFFTAEYKSCLNLQGVPSEIRVDELEGGFYLENNHANENLEYSEGESNLIKILGECYFHVAGTFDFNKKSPIKWQ
jgi:hypothetical protein